MSEPCPGQSAVGSAPQPGPVDQIAGLSFAMLLVSPDHEVADVNPAGEDLLGASAQRLLGQSLNDIIRFGESRLTEELNNPASQFTARGLDLLIGDRTVRANMTVSTLPAHLGWRVVTLSETGQGERLEELDHRPALRGPAVLAHEIKNPLAAIRGAVQLISRKVGEAETSLTDMVIGEVDRIAQLVDRMQRLGREQVDPVGPLNLHRVIHQATDTAKFSSSDTSIAWKEEFDPSLPPVLASEGALTQVLVNLMTNARDAARASDAPEVRLRTRFVSASVTSTNRDGQVIRLPIEIQISDNGDGIDENVRDHIFEPFVSSKINGQGLGLPLVQKLVRDMDGRVSHERDNASGWTHFRIHLPVANMKENP